MAIVALATTLSAATAAACKSPATEIVVVVDTDYRVPDELSGVQAHVRDQAGTEVGSPTFDLDAERLPFSFAVVPRNDDPSRHVTIELEGLHAGAVVVARRATTSFRAERTLMLPMLLSRTCEAVWRGCAENETCGDAGRCASAEVDPATLREVRPGQELARLAGGCLSDAECGDGVFCNGAESCRPGQPGADARGCVAPSAAPCLPGQTCDEPGKRCVSDCGVRTDADRDGVDWVGCPGGTDCDDANPMVFPGAAELCNRIDDDCSSGGGTDESEDADADGYVSLDATCSGGPLMQGDCDDLLRTVHPGAPETCDGVDEDCNFILDDEPQASASCAPGDTCVGGSCAGETCSESPCRLLSPQCGCLGAEACQLHRDGSRACGTAGTLPRGAQCVGDGDCAAGLLCYRFPDSTFPFCYQACEVTSTCPGGAAGVCAPVLDDVGTVVTGVGACTDDCGLRDSSGCPMATACRVIESRDMRTGTLCLRQGPGFEGDACTSGAECDRTLDCVGVAGSARCRRYCQLDAMPSDCTMPQTCMPTIPETTIAGVSYGFCE